MALDHADSALIVGRSEALLRLRRIFAGVGTPAMLALTVIDYACYLLRCEPLESTREEMAITAEQPLRERGLPDAIRSDSGAPFASPNGLFGLSKLSM